MKYREIVDGIFLDRPNRFIAHVGVNGTVETVHVKNTGRCKELLLPGAAVRLEVSDNPKRKTKYDLVAVRKQELGWVNMDSQAPNKVVGEWLSKQEFDLVRPEFAYGKSRIDFYMEKGEQKYLLEVKGCTLEVGGIGYFPDAPTERGVKHLHELAQAHAYDAYRKARNKDSYRAAHEREIILHEAAAKALKAAGVSKLPNLTALQSEYEKLQEQKEALYADYGRLKKQVKEYDVIKQNIDSILRQPREPEREKGKERGE